ncbi:MAG: hypothetical protein ABI456_11695 [Ktedonobacteraceae bacterium]|nr:hypothetical protein [Chloroflexota bacterium]
MAVHRPHSDTSRRRDVTHWCLDTGRDEHGSGGGEQRLLVALRVGTLLPGWLPRSLVDGGHRFIPSNKSLTNGTTFRILFIGALLR